MSDDLNERFVGRLRVGPVTVAASESLVTAAGSGDNAIHLDAYFRQNGFVQSPIYEIDIDICQTEWFLLAVWFTTVPPIIANFHR